MFDKQFNLQLKSTVLNGDVGALDKFRQRQVALLRRLAEADGLLLALAEIELTMIKAKQSGITLGRRALNCYRKEGEGARSSLKNIA